LFITFEGGEGSGKSTQQARIAARLAAAGQPPLCVREPGGTPFAEAARGLLLDGTHRPPPLAEAFLIQAARADLMRAVIAPALAAGRIVLCDRHTDSTLAYQGAGRGLDPDLLHAMNRASTLGLTPELTLLYDLDPAVGLARRAAAPGSRNRLDQEPLEFHARVRQGFLQLARAEPARIVVLDGSLDPAALEERSWAALEARLSARKPGAARGR
jgi:dTMP kinase